MKDPIYRKHLFELPEGLIYLDGNSLGPLSKGVTSRANQTIEKEWGQQLINAWNQSDWISFPKRLGDKIAPLIGAEQGTTTTGDTLSIKIFQALSAALKMQPSRKLILSDTGNFPSDLYIADGLTKLLGADYKVKTVAPEQVERHLDEQVAVLLLTHVDYRTGRKHDLEALTKKAQAVGAVCVWDLAHSAGAVHLDLKASQAEFAVGCTYKYFNGGPGSPAFIYVRPDLIDQIQPSLSGWLGHKSPFEMDQSYAPADGIERMRIGTPSIIQMAVLDQALDVWQDVDMKSLEAASMELSQAFIASVERKCPDLKLASPRNPNERGSQVSFSFPHAFAVVQALKHLNTIGDFRQPNFMRFGFSPLYLSLHDMAEATDRLQKVMIDRLWQKPQFHIKSRVT